MTTNIGLLQAEIDETTLNLNSEDKVQINLAHANTWTASQTFTNNSSLLVLGSANSWTLSANTGIKGTAITLTIPSNLSNNTFIINNSSSVPIFSVSGELNNLTSYHNTLDDGSGNATFTTSGAGIVSANGIKTTAGAATAVTVGASPYTYTNSSASNQQIFIQGGTVGAAVYVIVSVSSGRMVSTLSVSPLKAMPVPPLGLKLIADTVPPCMNIC